MRTNRISTKLIRFDEAKSAVDQFQAQRKGQALQIKQYEDRKDRAEDATERKQLEDAISSLKSQMETWSPEEQEAQSNEIELAQQLRTEQAKLDQLQDELDQLDRAVMNAAFHPPIAPQ